MCNAPTITANTQVDASRLKRLNDLERLVRGFVIQDDVVLNTAFRMVFLLVINYLVKTEQGHIFLFSLAIYPSNPRLEQLGVL